MTTNIIIKDLFSKVSNIKDYNLRNKKQLYKTYSYLKGLTANMNKEIEHTLFLEFRLIAKNFSNKEDYTNYLQGEGFKKDLINELNNKLIDIKYYR